MSRSKVAATLALVLLLAPAPALAKGKKGRGGREGRDEDIALTGFKSIDKVFREVSDIDERIDVAEDAMSTAKRQLNTALELKRGTPLKDAITDLKQKGGDNLQLLMVGNVPKLTAADAAPQNITDAVAAVNGMTSALVTSIDQLAGIPDDIQGLTKALDGLPDKARAEFEGDPIGALFKAPKLLKSIKGNLAVTTGLPSRSVDVSQRAASIVSLVSTEFKPAAGRDGSAPDNPRTRR